MKHDKPSVPGMGGRRPATSRPTLITGGAGFIGANLASRLLQQGEKVVLYDNLSRDGVERNYEWLLETYGSSVSLRLADIRDRDALSDAVREASSVFHFAAQVAVTTSLADARFDFEVNALGAVNLLEAMRSLREPPPLVFTSTNKVYGSLRDVTLQKVEDRYEPADPLLRAAGISEAQRLEFYSPYGCSKGAADQYVLDHARLFDLPAVVFRMSCIYGPHQFGTEDQGWVAHFLLQAMDQRPITLYGDGKQVRDILFVDDLVEALLLARRHAKRLAGEAFNIGGGPGNTTSLLELLQLVADLQGSAPRIDWGDWRPGDQRYYVTNFAKFAGATTWRPRVTVAEGVRQLATWLRQSRAKQTLIEAA